MTTAAFPLFDWPRPECLLLPARASKDLLGRWQQQRELVLSRHIVAPPGDNKGQPGRERKKGLSEQCGPDDADARVTDLLPSLFRYREPGGQPYHALPTRNSHARRVSTKKAKQKEIA